MRLTIHLSFIALLALLSGCLHVRLDAASLLSPDERPDSAQLGPGYRVEQGVIVQDDRIIGITRAHRPGNRAVILFCGGDSFRRSRNGGTVLRALAVDADVVLFDYPGFGDSTGVPTPESLVDNARAAHRFLTSLSTTPRQRVVVYGFSLGGMVAAQLVGEIAADALILESTAADVASWARTQVPWYAAPFVHVDIAPAIDRIDSIRALAAFRGPVLLLAGRRDRRAPVSLSRDFHRRLLAAGTRAVLIEVPGAEHGGIHRSPEFGPALDKFLAAL